MTHKMTAHTQIIVKKSFTSLVACALALVAGSAAAGHYGQKQGAVGYSVDNPAVQLPPTLPNWLLIPHASEPLVEGGIESQDSYTPVLIAGTPIVSSPYYGVQTEFQGSELLVNAATINKDLALLQVRQNFYNAVTRRGEPVPQHPILEISGLLEGQMTKTNNFDNKFGSDINLSGAEVDIFAGLNEWVSAFLQIEYDDSKNRPRRVSNSAVKVGSAFITIGNLNANDFYVTLGQMYLPFGQYSSSLVTNSFAKTLGRTKQRAAQVGYYNHQGQHVINASVFAYRGDTDTGGSFLKGADEVNGVGGNVSYHYDGAQYDFSLGASIVNNLAESDGLQRVFSLGQMVERLDHQVPGIDLRAKFKTGPHALIAEYVGATRSFDKYDDIAHDGHGAQPQALHVEYAHNFEFKRVPATAAIGYDHSWDALAIGLPEQRASAALSFALFKATIVSLEYRYDHDYGKNDVAGTLDSHGDVETVYGLGTGNCAHSLTAQIDVFF